MMASTVRCVEKSGPSLASAPMLADSGESKFQQVPGDTVQSAALLSCQSTKDDAPQLRSLLGQRNTILVIDDEAPVRDVLRELLQASGYPVVAAADGHAGVEVFREHHQSVGLVILDMVMPGLGGPETYQMLRQIDSDCPVLVCTGYSGAADLQAMRQQGIAGILPKPVRLAVLREAVATQRREHK